MNCVKCGREIEENQVFCETCLEEMKQYPVKPDTAIHIPSHKQEDELKKANPRKKLLLSPSEQIQKLKRKILRLRILILLLVMLCGALSYVLARTVEELDFQRLLGQNYHTEESNPKSEQSKLTDEMPVS